MRKLLLVAMTMSLTAISCGEDRDENTTQQPTLSQKIVGTWKITKKESNGVNIPASNPCQNLGNFVFSSDKKLAENHNSVVNNNCVTDTDNYTYIVDENSNKVTAKNSYGDQMIYVVSNLTDNGMVLTNVEGSDTIKYTFSK
jgi:hypothetical protein